MDKIPATAIYGLLGFPIKHSLSPAMHNAAFRHFGLSARYRLFELPPEKLESFFKDIRKQGISGFNITIPYKEKALKYMDKLDENARLIGAVNTVKVEKSGLSGFNTDGEGFLTHLTQDLGFAVSGKAIAVIGAGGASRAICVYLSSAQPASINIFDVDAAKCLSLVGHLKDNFPAIKFRAVGSMQELGIEESDLLINASPMGMKETDPLPIREDQLHPDLFVYDIIYNPAHTRLLSLAKEKGLNHSNGLGMLLYQGMASFNIWTGLTPPREIMQNALSSAL